MSFSFDRCSCGRLNIHGATCVCESESRHDGAVGDARKRGAAPAPVPDDEAETNGCDCTELCEMGPTCPGGMLAELPGSGCWRTQDGVPDHEALIEAVIGAKLLSADGIARAITHAGYVSPEAHAAAVREAVRAHGELIAEAIEAYEDKHDSSWSKYGRHALVQAARIAREAVQ